MGVITGHLRGVEVDIPLRQRFVGTHDHLHLLAVVREVVAVLHLAAMRLEGGRVVAQCAAPVVPCCAPEVARYAIRTVPPGACTRTVLVLCLGP